MAIQFVGLALNATDKYTEAVAILEKTFEKDFSSKDSAFGFNGKPWDMKKRAAIWIQHIARKRNDDNLIDNMKIKYPEYF